MLRLQFAILLTALLSIGCDSTETHDGGDASDTSDDATADATTDGDANNTSDADATTDTLTDVASDNDSNCVDRTDSLLAERFGYGAATTGGAGGTFTKIMSLTDGSLLSALTDGEARWIYFDSALDGQTWEVPAGATALGPDKTIDGRGLNITWQYGYPNNNININSDPVMQPPKTGQLNAQQGNLIMTGIRHVGDLGWPYTYESPYFSNGATDGLEIWSGSNYWIHKNTWSRMSDESLGVFHLMEGKPDNITFSNNLFLETKTASLIGANGPLTHKGHITLAFNDYREMVNGRSPGEFRNMFAHVLNNVVNYVNDEGMRVAEGASVYSQYNFLNMGCNVGTSGPRFARGVLPDNPALGPIGKLFSEGDIVPDEVRNCTATTDSGFDEPPASPPFEIPTDAAYQNYTLLIETGQTIDAYVRDNSGAQADTTVYCDPTN